MIGIKNKESINLEKKEIALLLMQIILIICVLLFSSLFWLLFITNILLLIISIFWIFEVKPTKEEIKKDFVYFLMPVIYFSSVIFFLNCIKTFLLQLLLLIFYIVSNYIFINNIVAVRENSEDCSISSRNMVSMITFMMLFLVLVDFTNAFIFYKIPQFIFLTAAFIIIGVIAYFHFLQYELWDKKTRLFTYLISFVMVQTLWVGTFWTVNYPFSKIGEIGIPLIAILSLVVYYTVWGISHHKLTNTLTKKVLTEYLMIAGMIIFILLVTTRWIPQGIIG